MSSDVKENLRNAQLVLESLKRDHVQALRSLSVYSCAQDQTTNCDASVRPKDEKTFNFEKVPLINSALSRIQDGLDESDVLLTFARYVECLEAEILKLRLHNQRLHEETSWLRDELKDTQVKLSDNESLLAQVISEKQHLDFLLELNKVCCTTNGPKEGLDRSHERIFDRFCGLNSSPRPSMSASVVGLTRSARHTTTLPKQCRTGSLGLTHDNISPLADSQTLDISAFMNSSLCDSQMNVFGRAKSFHPWLLNSHEPTASRSPTVPPSLRTLHRIVVQYLNQGKHEFATPLCLQAISDLERSGGRNQAEVAVLLNILALVYRDEGKYSEAAELLKEVVSIRERLFGPDNLLVAASLNNLAVLYAKTARFTDAEPLCRRALAIREKLLGPNHLDVAKQLNNLALLCQSQDRFEEVELCFKKALDIYLKHYKPSSATVLRAKNNLASALLKRGNLGDAEILLKAILSPNQSNHESSVCRPTSSNTLGCAEADSAVFSGSSIDGSCTAVPTEYLNGQSTTVSPRVLPLWLLVEQAGKEGRGQLSRLSTFNLSFWASEAHVDLPIVLSAIRNLAIVYQRRGLLAHANLLRSWIQPQINANTPNGAGVSAEPKNVTKQTVLRDLSLSCLPCPSQHTNVCANRCFN